MKLLTARWIVGIFMLGVVSYYAGELGESTLLNILGITSILLIPTPLEVKRSLQ